MASHSSRFSEEQFLCVICLEVFKSPVSTPCGHNFCLACISLYWQNEDVCRCPICQTTFTKKPDLKVNTFISGLTAQLASLQMEEPSAWISNLQPVKPGRRILCDVCTEMKNEAVKSCLECLTCYCDVHLEPHQRVAGLKRHTLVEPQENLANSVCKNHNRPLLMFCKTDELVLCDLCVKLQHLTHNNVPVERAYRERKDTLGRTEAQGLRMIQERLQKVTEIEESVKQRQEDECDVWLNTSEELNRLVSEIQESNAEILRVVEKKTKTAREQADVYIKDLESEMKELQRTNTKLREFLDMDDHLLLLTVPSSQLHLPPTRDWSRVSLNRRLSLQHMRKTMRRLVSQLRTTLGEVNAAILKYSDEAKLSDVEAMLEAQQHEVDFKLDSSTAHPLLFLFGNGRCVTLGNKIHHLPGNPRTFTKHLAVLGDTGFNTKSYFQVGVGQKTEWCLGVATETIPRQGLSRCPDSGLWAIWFFPDRIETFDRPDVAVYSKKVEIVGVYVDYDGGRVSFYDVTRATLIHAFTDCVFTEKLYPYLNPCDNEFGNNKPPMVLLRVESE